MHTESARLDSESTSSIVSASTLLYTYRHRMYFLLPSSTSMSWSTSMSSRISSSQWCILYSASTLSTVLSSILVSPPGTVLFTWTPPLCFFLMYTRGGVWFRRRPTASSSLVRISLCA